ncbi:tetratricopeptide repeat protein [Actinoplanes sp. TRM 88003]|uniref:Tetratricopeptide repeat protein n=1 Tax=Paractinoplanes aksuensis TaxID=2939490 RepID=A0ABT1DWD4_9ACTN|nr:tetratricopeptide repeat protein [Actinoplanes aksuensis]MCO8275163.1 tetratricopeptide repeat protein [Actinoplanes aksuensis]
MTSPGAPVAWLDSERHTLVAVAVHTATHGWPAHTTRLSGVLFRYLIGGGHHSEALTAYKNAYAAALGSEDLAGQAAALTNLGISYLYAEQDDLAADHLRRALDLWRRIGHPRNEGRALFSLAAIEERASRFQASADLLRESLACYREAGDETNVTTVLGSLAIALDRLGHTDEAMEAGLQGLAQARRVGHEHGEGYALDVLGNIEMRAGRYEQAREHLGQCLILRRRLHNRLGEGSALDSLGMLHTHLNDLDEAAGYFEQALALFREIGSQEGLAFSSNGLGEVALKAGRPALDHFTRAHAIATEIENRYQQARAAAGLGHAHRALDDETAARLHFKQALSLYEDLGVPEAEQIRPLLDRS